MCDAARLIALDLYTTIYGDIQYPLFPLLQEQRSLLLLA